jgi:hypothetical protein
MPARTWRKLIDVAGDMKPASGDQVKPSSRNEAPGGARQLLRVPVEGGNRQWENPRFFGKVKGVGNRFFTRREKTLRSHGRPKSNITVPDATQRRSGRIAGTLALAASVSSGEVRHRRLDAPYNSLLLFRAGRRVIEDLTHPTTCGRVECSDCLRVGSRSQCLSLHSPLMASRRGIRILCITLTTERLSR